VKVSIVCSNPSHPVNAFLEAWMKRESNVHDIELVRKICHLTGGEILLLVSCNEILTHKHRALYRASLVLHASDLPRGRGWSPHIWEIASGSALITLSLIEAEDRLDSGRIWKKIQISVPNNALWDEINYLLFSAEIQMIDFALKAFQQIEPVEPIEQSNKVVPTYYRLRNKQDSCLDPNKSIAEQFDLIRIYDSNKYPTFFDYMGQRFVLKLEKINDE